jgi:hypothetical protein
MSSSAYRFGVIQKDPAETLKVSLSLFRVCANTWRPNEQYLVAEHVRPTRATGYSYECTTAGTSGAREPVWNRSADADMAALDGSVQWTCREAGDNGLNAVSSPSAVSDPIGLTIADVSISESAKILATYSGGTLGQDYDAVFSFTLDGVPRVARQRVEIRKR